MKTKTCKYCRSEIDKKAKVCPVCRKRQKSGLGIAVGTIFVFLGIVLLALGFSDSPTKAIQADTVTIENFNKIETGMTYEQVCDILGKDGAVVSEVDIGVTGYKTTIYSWYDNTGIANCNVTVQGGKVMAKAQIGLK